MGRFTKKYLCIFFVLVGMNISSAQDEALETHELNSSLGKVKGSLMTSRLGKKIYSFRGVRYAEPPVGQRRFQPAEPVKAWTEVFDASQEGPACPQPGDTTISEDCLRLNVYTNELPDKDKEVKKPVIVFFHPGGFYVRSGQSHLEGPEYLLDKEIVLVTVNYRLGSLGFMSTGDSLLPGNLGLKDQVVALRWIRDNIKEYGGDPDSVTITGYSAGSWSVSLHMVSPMSKGLFHRAIAMSGSAIYQKPLPMEQKNLAIKQAEILDCPTDTVGNMLICMNTKTAEEFANSLSQFFEWHGDPILVWTPVIEPEVNGVERFLPDDPVKLIKEGNFSQVPFIGGFNKDEFGGVSLLPIAEAKKGNFSLFDEWNTNWDSIAPISFLYERDTNRSKEISKELYKFYNHDKPISVDNLQGIADLYCDGVIAYSEHRLINLLASSSKMPIYYYHFTYQGRYSHVIDPETQKPYGVSHHDDLLYLFYIKQFPFFKENDPELMTVERMTAIWENFAKTGKPIPEGNDLFKNVTWNEFTSENKCYLEISNELTMKDGVINPERMNFWDKLFPL
ncbi:esterase FE4-like [Leptopilina heterotoma]|uniref:esterase FE4-like n=1 Tax=Leptopilina heterotoma TaxID=63436 RepID=UPI001CA81369|nr:esterase FE4-like [Leptopilina heterotoma]